MRRFVGADTSYFSCGFLFWTCFFFAVSFLWTGGGKGLFAIFLFKNFIFTFFCFVIRFLFLFILKEFGELSKHLYLMWKEVYLRQFSHLSILFIFKLSFLKKFSFNSELYIKCSIILVLSYCFKGISSL